MQYLCSVDQREYAEWCCACKFPLPPFCFKHAEEHLSKGSGHFLLPVVAHEMLATKPMYVQVTEWLLRLNRNFDLLREKYEEFSKWEEAIDAAYQEAQNYLIEAQKKAHQGFSEVKTHFLEEINRAINEAQLHALETQTFCPGNPLSQLLWYYDPVYVYTYQAFAFQAKCEKQFIDSVFHVSLQCTVPGFEHWKIDGNETILAEKLKLNDMEKRLQETIQLLQQEQKQRQVLSQEYAASSQRCSDLEKASENLTKLLQSKETQLVEFRANLEDACRKKVESEAQLAKAKSNLNNMELQVQTALQAKDEQYSALKTENVALLQQVKNINYQLEESKQSFYRLAELSEERDSSRSWQKPIAVKPSEVNYFDTATDRWQLLYRLDSEIKANYSSSSTFIGENRIFVCGGGAVGSKVANPYVDNCAYVLEGTGHVLPQTNMLTGRYSPGIIYDSLTNAVYVFGGSTAMNELMRCSEKFTLSSLQWQPLPDMCVGRTTFNPCIYSAIVYLCGGICISIEMYNPRSNTFALLPDATLPERYICAAVIQTGNLVVISGNYVWWWNLQLKKVILSEQHPELFTWSNCLPIAVGNIVHIVCFAKDCCGINMRNGVVEKEITL